MLGLAILCAFAASLTGIIATGRGRRFSYTVAELMQGKPIALAYVWVCVSTITSAIHATLLFDAAAREVVTAEVWPLTLSVGCSLLFVIAHIVIGKWAYDKRQTGVLG